MGCGENLVGALVWLCILIGLAAAKLNRETCRGPLGMETGEITDEQIRATSSHNEYLAAKYARYTSPGGRPEGGYGGWCPYQGINSSSQEYLEVDLRRLVAVTVIATQGRDPNFGGVEFVRHFRIQYLRPYQHNSNYWIDYKNKFNHTILEGNQGVEEEHVVEMDPPIVAQKIRIIPWTDNPRLVPVCLRLELYGCEWNDHVLYYSMPQGNQKENIMFIDYTYDGGMFNNNLLNGIGQLMDGVKGETDFRIGNPPGYHWVGWDLQHTPQPEISFTFDALRNFSLVTLHCNNNFDMESKLPHLVTVWFSTDCGYHLPPLIYQTIKDDVHLESKDIEVNLGHNVAKCVKFRFDYTSSWILLSEVWFESESVAEDYVPPDDFGAFPYQPKMVEPSKTPAVIDIPLDISQQHPNSDGSSLHGGTGQKPVLDGDHLPMGSSNHTNQTRVVEGVPDRGSSQSSQTRLHIIIGVLFTAVAVLLVAVVVLVLRQRRYAKLRGGGAGGDHTYPVRFQNQVKDNRLSNPGYQVVVGGGAAAPLAPLQEPLLLKPAKLPELEQGAQDSLAGNRIYAEPDLTRMTGGASLPATAGRSLFHSYAEADVVSIQGVSGNATYAVPSGSIEKLNFDCSPIEFPRERLQFLELLGEGQFGEVHLCETTGLKHGHGRRSTQTVQVAVKTLRKDANKNARADFYKEVKIMSQLKHPNIVQLLGVCTGEEPLCMIVEYMVNGDLNQYLYDRELEGSSSANLEGASHANTISLGALLHMAVQVVEGMRYLASLNFVHRDLASRNCLVGRAYTIKIADFGMSRRLYSADYYRIEGRAVLPIRWMAWESLLYGKFSTQSDVWAFGVTLWEILTLAKEQPYSDLTDEQVIDNTNEYYQETGNQAVLPRPPSCPDEVYYAMKKCWSVDPDNRPTFEYLLQFLQQRNIAYELPV